MLGLLFLFSFLCFESSISRSGSSKRTKVIPLSNITDIQKVPDHHTELWVYVVQMNILCELSVLFPQYKVLSVLPGSGMGISVATPSTLKVRGLMRRKTPVNISSLVTSGF